MTTDHHYELGRFTARRYRLHTRERGSVTVWGDATAHVTKDATSGTLLLTLEYSRSSTLDRWAAWHPMGALMQLTCWSRLKTQPTEPPQWAVLGMLFRTSHVSTGLIKGRAPQTPGMPTPLRLAWQTAPGDPVAVTQTPAAP